MCLILLIFPKKCPSIIIYKYHVCELTQKMLVKKYNTLLDINSYNADALGIILFITRHIIFNTYYFSNHWTLILNMFLYTITNIINCLMLITIQHINNCQTLIMLVLFCHLLDTHCNVYMNAIITHELFLYYKMI